MVRKKVEREVGYKLWNICVFMFCCIGNGIWKFLGNMFRFEVWKDFFYLIMEDALDEYNCEDREIC